MDRQQHDMLVQHFVVLQVVQQARRRIAREGGEIDRRALRAMDAARRDTGEQALHAERVLVLARRHGAAALHPRPHRGEDRHSERQRHPAALRELHQVGGEQQRVDGEKQAEHR